MYLKIKNKILNFLLHFQNVYKNLEYFEKKDELQRLFVSEVIDCKKRGYLNT